MKTKKKSKFMTFCFSFIPGGGQMYMGFMKTGLSLMLLFALTIIVASWTNQGALAPICVVSGFIAFSIQTIWQAWMMKSSARWRIPTFSAWTAFPG